MPIEIMTVVGARPQFVKAAAVSRAIAKNDNIREHIVHTGQHFDANMSQSFFDQLSIPAPALNLDIAGSSHGAMTGRMLEACEAAMLDKKPDGVLLYGDTNSTLAGALAASKLHIPVLHVEAGLRSFARTMPEEINRVVTDHVSDGLFCPTLVSVEQLKREGITRGVHMVGDVMYDATLHASNTAETESTVRRDLGLNPKGYGVMTIHRASNTDDPSTLREMLTYISENSGGQELIFPVHPRTRSLLKESNVLPDNIRAIDPVPYLDMHQLLSGASTVFTDSGGLQKEAYFHGVPCVTLREETEWTETIDNGWNRLWKGADYSERKTIEDYGTGNASDLIVTIVESMLS